MSGKSLPTPGEYSLASNERIKKRKVYNCLKLLGTNEGRSKIIHFVIDDDLTTEKYLTKINEITQVSLKVIISILLID